VQHIKIGVVGATGMVGEVFLTMLEERRFPFSDLRLFASDKSAGQTRTAGNRDFKVQSLSPGCFKGLDLVFFSSGDDISRDWAPRAVDSGAFAVDNSAAFRLRDDTALVVPEINPDQLPPRNKPAIIANPNCSTIQLVMALKPLRDKFGLTQVRVATYQSVSGAGRPAQEELVRNSKSLLTGGKEEMPKNFPHSIAFNSIPQIGGFGDDGFCSEERKIRLETRKILDLPDLKISAWTVRVPTMNAHSEAAWVTLDKTVSRKEVVAALKSMPGVVVMDDGPTNYPMARQASGTDPVYVGRIHQDPDDPATWLLWIVGDNLRKGAALNGIQIAEALYGIKP
jgi:aspartate-semialdehyde dehydrogenase